MMRFREYTTETAGFYNTVGFNDDTRAFLSIPARHDVARRVDCSFLARLVVADRLDEDETFEVASELAGGLGRKAYRLWERWTISTCRNNGRVARHASYNPQ